ncbi:MAG: alpha/beta hydrolase [Haloferacaceae archaeon]
MSGGDGGGGDGLPEIPPEVPGESVRIDANDVELHAVRAGPENGPLVVLLHGFPEFWYGWHEAIAPLANAGYRVVVPDQRGYNRSEKPSPVSAYHIDELAGDVAGLIEAHDRESAGVVGHDWGAAVGWWLAMHRPERVSSLVAVNVPHPSVMYRRLEESWSQRLRSWYVLGFQLPRVPERVARAGNWRLLVRGMRRTSLPGTFSTTDFRRYRRAWDRPRAFTAMVNWYRAVGRDRPQPETERVEPPTMVIWGAQDGFLERQMARESLEYCENSRLKTHEDATHWVQHEEPVAVAEEIRDHLDTFTRVARK